MQIDYECLSTVVTADLQLVLARFPDPCFFNPPGDASNASRNTTLPDAAMMASPNLAQTLDFHKNTHSLLAKLVLRVEHMSTQNLRHLEHVYLVLLE